MPSVSTPSSHLRWVIGVGASAGGLEALSQFVANLPPDFTGSIVIAQHLAPHNKSMMVELLSRQSPLPVLSAGDGEPLKAGTVYVIPPNNDADIVDGKILLAVADERTRPKPSIDDLFESLARSYGNRSVGIILSGTGSDGSKGIRAIRSVGGITLAQDDLSAKYDGMPRSAVDTGSIDSILPPEIIAKTLTEILAEHDERLKSNQLDQVGLQRIFNLIRDKLGQDFRSYKVGTMQRRILKRMAAVGAKSFEDYDAILSTTPGEVGQLAQDFLISVTNFFRDSDVYHALTNILNDRLRAKDPGEELRIWVAGCATGEEPYSIAMLVVDLLEQQRRAMPIKIFATDLDQDAILEARTGIYSHRDLESVPYDFRERFFQKRDSENYEIVKRIRDVVVFARQDLVQNPPFVKLDLISCRNVMIYFEPELQRRILEIFHYALAPAGILLLGKAESVLTTPELFTTIDKKMKIYEKLDVPSKIIPTARMRSAQFKTAGPELEFSKRRSDPEPSLAELGYRRLADVFGFSGVIVDTDSNLLQVLGDVSMYVRFFNTQADLRLVNLVPKTVGIELPMLLRKARDSGSIQKSRTYRSEGNTPSFRLLVQSLFDDRSAKARSKELFLVTFEKRKSAAHALPERFQDHEVPERMAEIEQELFVTREHLQTVIEELGVSNEELQSLNEELSSTNEELQASNEELETTNEELQSSNEELTTVNEELSAKSAELRALNTSLENIQNSIGSPMVVLDTRLRILRYNVDAKAIFHVSPSDIGREITKVSATCEIPEFEDRVRSALTSGKSFECICETAQVSYQLRILPYYDEAQKITGVILIFIDNTERIRTQSRLESSESRIRSIINGSSSLIFVKDSLGRYLLVNEAFRAFFGLDERDIIGKTDREILPERIATQFRDADLESMIKRASVRREETVHSAGHRYVFFTNRFPLFEGTSQTPYGVGTIATDITKQIEAQESLQKSETRYRAIIEDQAVFVCRHRPDGTLTYTNPVFASYFGGTSDSNIGRNISEVIERPDDKLSFSRVIKALSPQHPVAQFEHRVFRLGAEPRWVRWIHRGIFNSEGEIIETQSVGFDVTEYRKQTDELLQKEAVFSGVFNNTSDFISIFRVVKDELVLESLNRSAEKSFGVAFAQLIGKRIGELLEGDRNESALNYYKRVLATGHPEVLDEEIHLPGGMKYFSTTIVPIPGPTGKIERVATLSRDVSRYKNIESDLRRAKDGAEIANRAKSDFLASMSHELRTPLNVVLGLCQLLEHSDLDPEQKGFVTSIHRSGKVLLNLIEDILDISKIEAGKIKLNPLPFELNEVASEVIELFHAQASEKGIALSLDLPPEADRVVIGDPVRLRQVIVNLVGNALKFTDHGEIRLKVRTAGMSDDGSQIFRFIVEDTGIGIREEDFSKIFEKFSQVETGHSRRYGGTGLGLVISKNLVTLMKGEMGFSSTWRKGTTFWFTVQLPVSTHTRDLSLVDKKRQKTTQVAISKRPLKILAIDDNKESQKVIELFLKRLGHEAVTASSGHDALRLITRNDFDLALMDVQMPEIDGYETTARIRQSESGGQRRLPIIALTANAMSGDADKCYEAGMDDYLTKPVELEKLELILNKWMVEIEASRPLGESKGTK